ncbi:aminoglycoside phosphotransferase family protein [Sediminibacillus terrae]|uniref:aminoglycoside phosphotransferase family protein n=1 Tax=Sediminibacillus terrae TaxID=1562106 RepID=UPI001297406B|nr:aminoglycoside phosphotransferase family protein [Sediminibacillus terrae]
MNEQTILSIISHHFPALTIETTNFNHTGWDHDILILNNELVFRFPKNHDVHRHTEREIALLQAIKQARPPLQIPNCQTLQDIHGRTIAIYYPLIEGEALTCHQHAALLSNQHNAKLLGEFLSKLHQLPVKQVDSPLFTIHTPDYWEELFVSVEKYILPNLTEEEADMVSRFFRSFFPGIEQQPIQKTWIHGDLSANNIIFDKESKLVNGIIDFTDSQYGDPAFDFAGFYWDLGPDFTRQILQHYQGKEPVAKLFERVRNFYGLQPVFHELLYQLKRGQPVNWTTALEKFKRLKETKDIADQSMD